MRASKCLEPPIGDALPGAVVMTSVTSLQATKIISLTSFALDSASPGELSLCIVDMLDFTVAEVIKCAQHNGPSDIIGEHPNSTHAIPIVGPVICYYLPTFATTD